MHVYDINAKAVLGKIVLPFMFTTNSLANSLLTATVYAVNLGFACLQCVSLMLQYLCYPWTVVYADQSRYERVLCND